MISDRKQFCLRLKQARQEARIKQETVARYLQIPVSAVSAFESDHRKVDAIELYMLSKLYKKPLGWFFNEVPASMEFISTAQHANLAGNSGSNEDPLVAECIHLMRKAPANLQRSAAYGVIGFLSER